jgi:hypothetical protein
VLVPISADQPFHARRCAELSARRVVAAQDLTADALLEELPASGASRPSAAG